MNPLYQMFGNNNNNNNNFGPFGNFQRLVQQFNQFRSTFQGDPRQKVQELLNSGRMSQQQYNYLQNMATQFQNMMHMK